MAKSKAKKGNLIGLVVSAVAILLGLLMMVSFFFPTYTRYNENTDPIPVTTLHLLKANGLTSQEAVKLTAETGFSALGSIVFDKEDKEMSGKVSLITAYNMLNDSENGGKVKTSMYFNFLILVAGLIVTVLGVASVVTKKYTLSYVAGAGIAFVLMLVALIVNGISCKGFSDYFYVAKTGVAIILPLISAGVVTGGLAVGALTSPKSKRKK